MNLKVINESNNPTIFDVSYKQNDIYQANYVKAYSEEDVKEYFETKRQDAEYLGATDIGMRSVLKPGKPIIDLTKEENTNLNEADVRETKFDFLDNWYGNLDDIAKDFEDNGFEVYEINREYADIEDQDEIQYKVVFGGTDRTITIKSIELLESIVIETGNILKENFNQIEAKKDFDKLLEPFYGPDIKAIHEDENPDLESKSYVANIDSKGYEWWINEIKESNEYKYDQDLDEYIKDTDYGRVSIHFENEIITIQVEYLYITNM